MLDMKKIGLFNYLNQEERKREIDERIIKLRKVIDEAGGVNNFVDIQISFPFFLTKEEEIYFKSYFKDLDKVFENI